MEANGKIGAVSMKILRTLKGMCEENTIYRVICGGLIRRCEIVIDNAIRNRQKKLENGQDKAEMEKDNSMFGQEVLEELGITKEVSGGYVMAENKETQEQSQEDEMVL